MSEKILLIDGHSILNRAFYGLPDLTNSEGVHTGAIYGFLNILFKVLGEEKPEYLAVAFDRSEPTFRHEKYSEYKGTRRPMPGAEDPDSASEGNTGENGHCCCFHCRIRSR